MIDVPAPDGMGERSERRPSVSGFPTIASLGGTQALARSHVVEVQVGLRVGRVPRPPLVAALILKAEARIDTLGANRDRHCDDFAVLAAMLAAADVRGMKLTKGERQSLRTMIDLTRANQRAMSLVPNLDDRLSRLSSFID